MTSLPCPATIFQNPQVSSNKKTHPSQFTSTSAATEKGQKAWAHPQCLCLSFFLLIYWLLSSFCTPILLPPQATIPVFLIYVCFCKLQIIMICIIHINVGQIGHRYPSFTFSTPSTSLTVYTPSLQPPLCSPQLRSAPRCVCTMFGLSTLQDGHSEGDRHTACPANSAKSTSLWP